MEISTYGTFCGSHWKSDSPFFSEVIIIGSIWLKKIQFYKHHFLDNHFRFKWPDGQKPWNFILKNFHLSGRFRVFWGVKLITNFFYQHSLHQRLAYQKYSLTFLSFYLFKKVRSSWSWSRMKWTMVVNQLNLTRNRNFIIETISLNEMKWRKCRQFCGLFRKWSG